MRAMNFLGMKSIDHYIILFLKHFFLTGIGRRADTVINTGRFFIIAKKKLE
jgi:hypothetical protein